MLFSIQTNMEFLKRKGSNKEIKKILVTIDRIRMAIPKCDVDWNQNLDQKSCAIILAGKPS